MSYLELKVPPVLLFILGLIGVGLLPAPLSIDWLPLRYVAAFLFLASLVFALNATYTFYLHRTSLHPHRPQNASSLVRSGAFRISRNPMYLSLALCLLSVSLWWGKLTGLIVVPLFILYLTRFQIIPEERALKGLFGAAYVEYCQQTRRWL